MKKDLDVVNKYQKEIILLRQVSALLNWDEETYMPKKGIDSRSEQAALLSEICHKKLVSDELFFCLKNLKKSDLKGRDKIIVEKLYKDVLKARKIPVKFIAELTKAITLGGAAWREARKKRKFSVFKDSLEKIVKLKRQQARYIGLGGHIYNSLLDDYEEGMTAEKLKPKFEELKNGLLKILEKIKSSELYKKQKLRLMNKEFPRDKQMEFVKDVVNRIVLESNKSRIDFSEHPFTERIGCGDVRITTSIRDNPLFSFESSIHEAGHALYELGLPEKDVYNILGDAPSLGLHESQSRFWENMIGKGEAFWKFYFPKFNKVFNLGANFNDWYKEVNLVFPGKIRIESNEVHYCLHVILRFEVELGLIDGNIKIKELPRIWNNKMNELFGVKVRDDFEGVLQDVHWSGGLFGYFPTYALGTIYAVQLYDTMKKELKNIEIEIARGNFSSVRFWLRDRVHRHGSKYLADELIKMVCGEGLNPKVYLDYLEKKYGRIYGF